MIAVSFWAALSGFIAGLLAMNLLSPFRIPRDVERLIVASRNVAFGSLFVRRDDIQRAAMKELADASEAFAARLPWEEEPPQ